MTEEGPPVIRIAGQADIDFSAVGGAVETTVVFVDVDERGQPWQAEIALPRAIAPNVINATPSNVGFLNGQKLRITLNGMSESEATVAIGFGLSFTEDGTPLLQVRLRDMMTKPLAKAPAPHHWEFKLSNYRISVGDDRTETPPPPHLAHIPGASGGFKVNRIDFTVAGRAWMLTDDLMGTDPHSNKKRVREALLSGTLSTPFALGDEWQTVAQVAEDVSWLLSFALCTWVAWARCSLVTDAGNPTWRYHRDIASAPYSSISPQIDQFDGGVIRGFLEETYPQFVANKDTLDHAIGVYVDARVSNSLLIRTALLNMLLDSLQDEIHAEDHDPQIDEKLPERLDEANFQAKFHALLSTLSGNWTAQRTKDLTGVIKGWESLGIKGFEKLKLGARHLLLHKAVLKLPDEEKTPYLFELDYLVFLMIARLLGYSGLFVHQHTGPDARKIADVASVIEEGEE